MIEKLDCAAWLEYNAKLQQKKNSLRKQLKGKGILKKGGKNEFDHYTYFSEAQYKALFTELLSASGLELKFSELEYQTFEGTEKQSNGRAVRLKFVLMDSDTGFLEETIITGEGIDKGDKAGYKAYTGALKYYLADTFLVATGDDPEKESPDTKMNNLKATKKQIEYLTRIYGEQLPKLLAMQKITDLSELPRSKASELIKTIAERKNENGQS